jgi:ankyrin repeat protein
MNNEIEVVNLLLRAKNGVSEQCLTDCLLPASSNGSLEVVLLLLRAGARGDHHNSEAFMLAIQADRADLAVAFLTGPNPPAPTSLNEALDSLLSGSSSSLKDRHDLIEIILCASPEGNAANDGLFKATLLANVETMQLLLAYNVNINYNGGAAVEHAIKRNRSDLVGILLQNQELTPEIASDLVHYIPRNIASPDRISVLSKLLVSGASGTYCNELLITSAEQNDLDLAHLLLFYGRDENLPSVCSVDYNAAKCLQVAVAQQNVPMVKILALEGKPSKYSVAKAFSAIPTRLSRDNQYMLIQSLLRAGAEGSEVDAAFYGAVTETQKSIRLIELFMHHGVSIPDQTLFSAVSQGSVDILSILMSGDISPDSCSAAIQLALNLPSNAIRFRIVGLLLGPVRSSGSDRAEISQSVIHILRHCPEDVKLLSLLCYDGKANINSQEGLAVDLGVKNSNPVILDVLLQSKGGLPTEETITRALKSALDLPLTDSHRQHKIDALLRHSKPQDALDNSLIQEIKSSITLKQFSPVIEVLLTAGANVNAQNGAPVCWAVSDPAIMDLLLTKRPSIKSLSIAFPLAMTFQEPARHILCEKLLLAGACGEEISKALCALIKDGPSSTSLMELLLPHADVNFDDGRALKLAVRRGFVEGVDILLKPRTIMPSQTTKAKAFEEAMKLKSKQDRSIIVKKLLEVGIPELLISDALVFAANVVDIELSEVLLEFGASVDFKGGIAIRSAASTGACKLLKLLVAEEHPSKPSLSALTSGFGGAMALRVKDKDAYFEVVQILLGAGMKGEAIDAALVDAVKEGDSNLKLCQLLHDGGASVEWQHGEAVDIATKLASIETLTLFLRKEPSQSVLTRAYKSALDLPKQQRNQVLAQILKAGKSIDKHVTNTLIFATQQTPSDRELIKLLLSYEVYDEGQSMIHAAISLDLRTLTLLVNSSKTSAYISSAFEKISGVKSLWQSATGLGIIEIMLKKGASGNSVGEALYQCVKKCEVGKDNLASKFLDILLQYNADVNYQRGLPLQQAALQFNIALIKKLVPGAISETKAMAIPYLFTACDDKEPLMTALLCFSSSSQHEDGFDVYFKHPDTSLLPVLFTALDKFPRETQILRALLDIGYPPNQWKLHEVHADTDNETEPWPIICWALEQPQKRISSANIEMLIDEGG